MTRRSALPPAWSEAARAVVPSLLLVAAAWVTWTRPFVLALLVAGTAIALGRRAPVRWAWAAGVPVATSLTWGLISAPEKGQLAASVCADPASPVALWRLGQAVLVLGTAVALGWILHAPAASAWMRLPRPRVLAYAAGALAVAAIGGLLVGGPLAGPFFGTIRLDVSQPGAIIPALVFAISNGVMEEVTYRGVLMGWLARVGGLWPAVVIQGIVFGLAHASGSDVGGSPLLLGAGMALAGVIAGIVTVRTGSLALAIGAHVGFDIALYYGLACRIAL